MGWKAQTTELGAESLTLLIPSSGGQERVLVNVGPTTAANLDELAKQMVQLVTQKLFPGLTASGEPKIADGVAEITYTGRGGQIAGWQALQLKDQKYVMVLTASPAARAAAVEPTARIVFANVKLYPPTVMAPAKK
jgi:hypothetical protein